jgi:hypothetical protein
MERASESGLPIDAVCDESKLTDFPPEEKLDHPGQCPFTRGGYPRTYLWHIDNGQRAVMSVMT